MRTQTYQIFAATSVALALSIVQAQAGYVDITVNDGTNPAKSYTVLDGPATGSTSSDPRGIGESGEVEPPSVTGAIWDLRAFAFDAATNHLMVVSAFNPLTDQPGSGSSNPLSGNNRIFLGDIFIDTINSFTIPAHGSTGFIDYTNANVGFEYVIDLTDPVGGLNFGYDVVQLGSTSELQSGYYPQNAASDPANLKDLGNGSVISSGNFSVTEKTDAQVLADLGINVGTNGGTNYIFTFDLSAASLANGATFRLTETCGNDLLVGHIAAGVAVAAVPETSTWVMGFLALGAVVFMVRRNARLSA
jgi:hypothetical protein